MIPEKIDQVHIKLDIISGKFDQVYIMLGIISGKFDRVYIELGMISEKFDRCTTSWVQFQKILIRGTCTPSDV